jgi:hypothetical protein
MLMTTPVLQLPDFAQGFIMECDASGFWLVIMLHQGVGLVAFFSWHLAPCHTNLSVYEHELI